MFKIALTAIAFVAAALASPSFADNSTSLRIDRRLEAADYMATMAGKPQCIIEKGFDFIGEDLANVPGASAELCCDKCLSTAGCKAFSWSNHEGGTCWLKRTRGQIVVNPEVHSALVTPGQRTTCKFHDLDTDLISNEIGNATNVTEPGLCCALCRDLPGCRTYTWTYSVETGGRCSFRAERGQPVFRIGVQAADAYPAVSYEESLFNAKDMHKDYAQGGDITNVKRPHADYCFQACRETTSCLAFTWTDHQSGTCWLKYGRGFYASDKKYAVSGVINQIFYSEGEILDNVDLAGNDIGNARDTTVGHCAYRCLNYVDGCKAVTWSDYNGGTCWFKSAVGNRIAMKGVSSAVMP